MSNVMTNLISADIMYAGGQLYENYYLAEEAGVITAFGPVSELTPEQQKSLKHYSDCLIIPGLVNSHNHSFQSLLKGFCDDCDFFTWRDKALYKYSKILSKDDLYTGALFAFAEMIRCGITTVCDFFYINDQDNHNARAIIQAAKDLGMRIVMARTMYDWDGAPTRFQESVSQAANNTEALMKEFANDPLASVLPAPHSLHGASLPMIEAGADLAKRMKTKFHMHIAEGEYERQMMEEKHGLSPIKLLNKIGVLNSDLVGIHCVWLDDEEIQLMAQQKSGLSYNPSSNMFLGDGITRIKEMLEAGVCISLGTDGGCSNNRASIIEEMRMTSLLQKVKFCNSTVTKAEDMFAMGTVNGGLNLGLPIGDLKPGYAADYTVVKLNDLSMQPCAGTARKNTIKNLVYSSQPESIHSVVVAGQTIFENGDLCKRPLSEITHRVQTLTQNWD